MAIRLQALLTAALSWIYSHHLILTPVSRRSCSGWKIFLGKKTTLSSRTPCSQLT